MSKFTQKVMIRKPPRDYNTPLEAFVFSASVMMILKKSMCLSLEKRGENLLLSTDIILKNGLP